jgi:hypothetical protein
MSVGFDVAGFGGMLVSEKDENVEAVTSAPHHQLRVNNALRNAVIPISGASMAPTYGDQCL